MAKVGTFPSEQNLRLQNLSQVRSLEKKEISGAKAPESLANNQEFLNLVKEQGKSELKFSNHAQKRLESRGISLSSDDILALQGAVRKAESKGSRESLILSDKAAFVVSVSNGTVITAVDRASMKENVFTNIDSTIMI